jgi:integrase
MTSAGELATERLRQRPIRESTFKEYMSTLRTLGLMNVDAEDISLALLTERLNRVLTASKRRKHAINLRAALGMPLPCPRPAQKLYDLPPLAELHQALSESPYRRWGWVMLYAGLRLGEACINQPLHGRTRQVDGQRMPDGTVAAAKTCGPVVMPAWLADPYQSTDFERSANTVYVGIRRAGRAAGFRLHPHVLRHAFATNLVRAGASPEVLRRQMRHHDVAVSLRYYVQPTQHDVDKAVDAISC